MKSRIGNKNPNYIPSFDAFQQISGQLVQAEKLTCINLFQPSVGFHEETSKISDWFLFEIQHWTEMG